eukprot:Clim_evm177s157 gene=Clim_evmTU177s157
MDKLDDLLADLEATVDKSRAAPPKPVESKLRESTPETKVSSKAGNLNDLDDLLNNLENKNPAAASFASEPHKSTEPLKTPAPQAAISDLDDLLGDIKTPANASVTPTGVESGTPAPKQQKKTEPVAKGTCAACLQPITGPKLDAAEQTYHQNCFNCVTCGKGLLSEVFYEHEYEIYCEADYQGLFCPKCAYCEKPVIDKCINALDQVWHVEHFFCSQCGNPFGADGFMAYEGKPYCQEDYNQIFAPKCSGCDKAIMKGCVQALGLQWHPECFVCADCREPFGDGRFFDHEGKPYCEYHWYAKTGTLCTNCDKPVTGKCMTAFGKKYHPEHFVCTYCQSPLEKGTFMEHKEKPFCQMCYVKLFG